MRPERADPSRRRRRGQQGPPRERPWAAAGHQRGRSWVEVREAWGWSVPDRCPSPPYPFATFGSLGPLSSPRCLAQDVAPKDLLENEGVARRRPLGANGDSTPLQPLLQGLSAKIAVAGLTTSAASLQATSVEKHAKLHVALIERGPAAGTAIRRGLSYPLGVFIPSLQDGRIRQVK